MLRQHVAQQQERTLRGLDILLAKAPVDIHASKAVAILFIRKRDAARRPGRLFGIEFERVTSVSILDQRVRQFACGQLSLK